MREFWRCEEGGGDADSRPQVRLGLWASPADADSRPQARLCLWASPAEFAAKAAERQHPFDEASLDVEMKRALLLRLTLGKEQSVKMQLDLLRRVSELEKSQEVQEEHARRVALRDSGVAPGVCILDLGWLEWKQLYLLYCIARDAINYCHEDARHQCSLCCIARDAIYEQRPRPCLRTRPVWPPRVQRSQVAVLC